MTALLVSGLLGWLLGNFPSAWLVVRRASGADVSEAGSANVGARNAWAVTGSRAVGVLVLVIDAAKGLAAVMAGWMAASWFGDPAAANLAWHCGAGALLCAVAGHNYNFFLSLRRGTLSGGKGLATAAGGFLLVAPVLVLIWAGLWLVGFIAFARATGVRDSIPGNVLATTLIPLFGWLLHGPEGLLATLIFAALALPRHRSQVRALLAGSASPRTPPPEGP